MASADQAGTRWERIAVFAFGVVFIGVLLALVTSKEPLSAVAYTFLRIVMALAAAGIGAAIPGFLHVNMRGAVRAGGAMAIFVVVFFFPPAAPTPLPGVERESTISELPKEPPEPVITRWLGLVDSGNYGEAWNVSSKATKRSYDFGAFTEVFKTQRLPLGPVESRVLQGLNSYSRLPTGQEGNFLVHTYKTRFSGNKEFLEVVVLTVEDGTWKIASHQIAPSQPAK